MNKDQNCLRLLAIDPGSNHCGFSVTDYNLRELTFNVIHAKTCDVKQALSMVKGKDLISLSNDERTVRLLGYSLYLRDLILKYEPDIIGSESPFLGDHPQSFRTLAELTFTFKLTNLSLDPLRDFLFVDPPSVKKNMGVAGNSNDKELMKRALLVRDGISYADTVDANNLDEHEVDSICVALWMASKVT